MGDSIGWGVSFVLQDMFSANAERISSKFGTLQSASETASSAISRSMNRIENGLAIAGIGAAIVAPLMLAVNESAKFEVQMKELSAITGVAGAGLDDIGNRALELATKFGGDPLKMVDSFKTILSRLGPDIAQSPIALQSMGDSVQTLAKTMGGDTLGSVNALTTAMLQYGIDLSDPIKASEAMAKQMNIMAAGAQVGSAEVPQIAETIKVAGLSASKAGVNFEEFNAAIQVMGKGTVYGAEAGTALRNVLGKLGESRFIPKDTAAELRKAGVDIQLLANTTIPLSDRLKELNKIQKDTALVGKFFGVENKNAAMLLMDNVNDLQKWTTAVSGTSSATDQAAIIMSSYTETIARGEAGLKVAAITIGNALRPAITAIVSKFSSLVEFFNEIAKSKFGQTVIQIAGALGVTLVVVGTAIAAWGAYELISVKVTKTIADMKKAFLGLNMSMLPILITIGVVIALREAYLSFQEVLNGGKAENGFLGFMQKVGGVISGIMELFSTATLSGFEFSDSMYKAFEKIGIADFMVGVGTWFVRLKAIFEGVSQGLTIFYNVAIAPLVEGFGNLFNAFTPLFDVFSRLFRDDSVVNATSNVNTWVGTVRTGFEIVAYAINFILLPVRLGIEMIGVAISFVANFGNAFINAYDQIAGSIDLWKQGWLTLPELFGNIGMAIVENLKAGFLGTWESFKTAVASAVESLPLGIGGFLSNTFGLNQEVQQTNNTNVKTSPLDSLGIPERLGQQTKESRQSSYSFSPTNNIQVPTQQMPNLVVVMDGEAVGRIQEERSQFEGNRK